MKKLQFQQKNNGTTVSFIEADVVHIDKKDAWEDSFFSDIYKRAEQLLRDIIKNSSTSLPRNSDALNRDLELTKHNQLIAFTGNRGTGKTSAMVSFIQACRNNDFMKDENCYFYVLPVIEPAQFAEEESLVGSVVSHLYSSLEDYGKEETQSSPYDDSKLIQHLISHFTNVREALRVRGQSASQLLQQNCDELSHLRMLSQAKRLREDLYRLIESWLTLRSSEKNARHFLIIPIDDMDMDTAISGIYSKTEELRSLLMLPNVIIIMALKIEQLTDALEARFIRKFQALRPTAPKKNSLLNAQPSEMAASYIQKVIPPQRRVEMPDGVVITRDTIFVDEEGEELPVVLSFIKRIYRNTGVLLVPGSDNSHPLIPKTLRSLHQLYLLLGNMKSQDELLAQPGGEVEAEKQLRVFETWLLEQLSFTQMELEMIDILNRFVKRDAAEATAFLWRSLTRRCSESGNFHAPDVASILERNVKNENITIGDVLYLLRLLQQTDTERDYAFLRAMVRALYSVKIRTAILRNMNPGKTPWWERISDEGYQRVQAILNGMIYDASVKITYDGFEQMLNGDAIEGVIQISPGETDGSSAKTDKNASAAASGDTHKNEILVNLNGVQIDADKNEVEPMSLQDAVWSSFFITVYGRVRNQDIHTAERSIFRSLLTTSFGGESRFALLQTKEANLEPAFVSANWMAFFHNLLTPEKTVNRLLWQVNRCWQTAYQSNEMMWDNAVGTYNDIRGEILFHEAHLDSVEFIDEVVWDMVDNIAEDFQKSGDVSTMNGYFLFRSGLMNALRRIRARLSDILEVCDMSSDTPLFKFLTPEELSDVLKAWDMPSDMPKPSKFLTPEQTKYVRKFLWMGH